MLFEVEIINWNRTSGSSMKLGCETVNNEPPPLPTPGSPAIRLACAIGWSSSGADLGILE